MNSYSRSGLGIILKSVLVLVLKLIGLVLVFSCKTVALVLNKFSELLENRIGHGTDH